MKIELQPEPIETVRVDELPVGDTFIDEGEFFMKISSTGNLQPGYNLAVRLATGITVATRCDVQVIPILLEPVKAKRIRITNPRPFGGIEGGS